MKDFLLFFFWGGGGLEPLYRVFSGSGNFGGLELVNLKPDLQLCLPDSCIVGVAELKKHRWVFKVEKILVKLGRLCLQNLFLSIHICSFKYMYNVHICICG